MIIDEYLKDNDFLSDGYSIADISMYPYIKLSYEGEIFLDKYKNILEWIKRVEEIKDFIPMY